jgi:hypothetical protein
MKIEIDMPEWLTVLFSPSYWMVNNTYSEAWDKKLNELLDKYEFEDTDSYTTTLGGVELWIANHPFSSFHPYGKHRLDVRPKRTTLIRAWKKFEAHQINFMEEKINRLGQEQKAAKPSRKSA